MATLESMKVVEDLKRGTTSNVGSLLPSWARSSKEFASGSSMVCTTQPSMEEVLAFDPIEAISPSSWFEQIGDAIADKTSCGAMLEEAERQISASQRQKSFEMEC